MNLVITSTWSDSAGSAGLFMPPAQKPIADNPVSQGTLVLKRQKHKSVPDGTRLVVYLISKSHKYSPHWLSLDAPRDHLREVLLAFPDVAAAEINDEFKQALCEGSVLPSPPSPQVSAPMQPPPPPMLPDCAPVVSEPPPPIAPSSSLDGALP